MLSLISFIVVLSILVIVHEFGHFIVAKRMGVRVATGRFADTGQSETLHEKLA